MDTKQKHWSEIGRVKTSDWFRNLPALEQAAVIAALEQDTHKSAVRLRAKLAVVYSTVVYATAFAFWGASLHSNILWLGLAGAIVGVALGLLSARAIVIQKTPNDAKAMQATTGMIIGLPGAIIAVTGLAFWITRWAVSH